MATPTLELTGNHKRRYKGFVYEARTREPDEEGATLDTTDGSEGVTFAGVVVPNADAGSPTWTTEEPVEEP